MDPLIVLAFVLAVGFFFVLLTRWQRGGGSAKHQHDAHCGHDHGHCHHDHDHSHDDHKDGGCCGGHHH
jgi:hypothetical protein